MSNKMNTVTTYEIVIVSNATTRAYSVSNPYTDLLSAQNDLNSRNELAAGSEYRIRKVETSYLLPNSEHYMNERILELAQQAGIFKPKEFYQHIDALQLKKFAELIVKECATQVFNTELDVCCSDSDVLCAVSFELKKHFGVQV